MSRANLFNIYYKRQDKRHMSTLQNNTIKTIELFAGVGGFRIGLENVKDNSSFKVI